MRNAIVRVLPLVILTLVTACPSGAMAAPEEDLTPPDVKLVKLNFKLNELDYSIDAPEGSTVAVNNSGAVVSKGKEFGFSIQQGKMRFVLDRRAWKASTDNVKRFIVSKKDVYLLESTAEGEKHFAAATAIGVPYIDFSICSETEGSSSAEMQSLANCLLILKCAKTLTLQSAQPTEPAAILDWLKADVRKDDDGKVVSIALPSSITDAALPLVAKFPTLKSLTIAGGRSPGEGITDEALAELEELTSLEELGLGFEAISDTQLRHIGNLPNLEILSLGATVGSAEIAQGGLAHLHALRNLHTLDLSNTRAGDEALACLQDMRSLKVLRLGSTLSTDKREGPERAKLNTLTDEGLASLAKLTNLETLSLRRTDITGVGFKHLAGLKNLASLELNDTLVTDEGLEHIGAIESLQLLQLARTNVTGEGLKHLANLEELKELDLTDTAIDDRGLGRISILRHLESLSLRRTHVTDDGMLHLETLRNLETLNLSETKITDAGLPRLYRLKKLQSLYTSDTAVTQDALDKLDKARESQ